MKKFLILGLLLFMVACGGLLRHNLVVASSTAHGILSTIQDTVNATTCDKVPNLPHCIDAVQRKTIAAKLSEAFQLDIDITKALKDWDGTTPQPSTVGPLLANLAVIIDDVVSLIPTSAQKNAMQARLGVK